MLRQVSNRNQRGKGGGHGLKMKNALQACLVIAICIWLIYQMTHSHGEKKIFEEGSSKALFKGGERQTDVKKFSRKDLSRMNKVEAIREIQSGDEEEIKSANKLGQRIGDEEVEDEGEESSGESREDEEEEAEAGHEEHDELDEHDHDEEAHKGGENEEASQAAREKSFKADDASSAVAHVTQSNGQETESENEAIWKNLDENDSDDKKMHRGKQELESEIEAAAKIFKRKEGEARDILKEKQENAGGDNSSVVHHQGISILQNKTTFESEHEGQQPGIRVSSTMNNQTAADELPINLNHQIYFQKNSTTVSLEQAESPANLTAKVDPNNVTISQYQTTVVHEQINTTKMLDREGEVPNLKIERAMEQKDSKTSSATNEIRKAVRLEADDSLGSQEKNRDVNIDALSSSDIQSKAQSSKPEAMAA